MNKEVPAEKTLQVAPGVITPPAINPKATLHSPRALRTAEDYAAGVLAGDRALLSQVITLVESTRPDHQALGQAVVERCLAQRGRSIRVGVTGVPGVGKSTLIDVLGARLTQRGHRVAVLAVDPTSAQSKGSILGDKTRMEQLAASPDAFIRPTPTAGSLGGVARATREAVLLCEAAGFDVLFVETVGVGQSETAVHSLVDFFLLLVLAGAGDALQGIKRGIIEHADAVVVTKADGDNLGRARAALSDYRSALRLFPVPASGLRPPVLRASARTGDGLDAVWEAIAEYQAHTQATGYFDERRRQQALRWMHQAIEHQLREAFFSDARIRSALPSVEDDVVQARLSPFAAAQKLLDQYRGDAPETP